ncbi:hypothetical protein DUI87_26894 [Hirundo rustica rustica]|uniref:Uncharacterized protein n=1 Tax=Hirundo rustica rustica TaxID=333673 RepID=A0A3M0JPS9_HIRRU|nr:hypothetical protein DUI87_26894 [Hirundo rustica rustica]
MCGREENLRQSLVDAGNKSSILLVPDTSQTCTVVGIWTPFSSDACDQMHFDLKIIHTISTFKSLAPVSSQSSRNLPNVARGLNYNGHNFQEEFSPICCLREDNNRYLRELKMWMGGRV